MITINPPSLPPSVPAEPPRLLLSIHSDDQLDKMGVAFDKCDTRPAHIDAILNGLDRYNPETTTVFQDYVVQQCEERTFDCYANLALLKL